MVDTYLGHVDDIAVLIKGPYNYTSFKTGSTSRVLSIGTPGRDMEILGACISIATVFAPAAITPYASVGLFTPYDEILDLNLVYTTTGIRYLAGRWYNPNLLTGGKKTIALKSTDNLYIRMTCAGGHTLNELTQGQLSVKFLYKRQDYA
jgi:hypothetical protein